MNRLYMMLLQNICAEFFVLLLSLSCVPMLVKIFLPGGKSAADVAFLFVHVKNFADALRQVGLICSRRSVQSLCLVVTI